MSKYAIYLVPYDDATNIFVTKDLKRLDANSKWGGIHVTIKGFSDNRGHRKFLESLTKNKTKYWSLGENIWVRGNQICFKSYNLDCIATKIVNNNFKNVKGSVYSGYPWHITFKNEVTKSDINFIKRFKRWDFVVVRKDKHGNITWNERYPAKLV